MPALSLDDESRARIISSLPLGFSLTSVAKALSSKGCYAVKIYTKCTIATAQPSSSDQHIIAPVMVSKSMKEIKRARNYALEKEFWVTLKPEKWSEIALKMANTELSKRCPLPDGGPTLLPDVSSSVDAGPTPLPDVRPNRVAKTAAQDCIAEAIKRCENRGGSRAGSGRPLGSVGQVERQKLLERYRWAISEECQVTADLTLRELRRCQAYYHQMEAEWTREARHLANKRGYKGGRARVKVNEWRITRDYAVEALEIEEQWQSGSIEKFDELLKEMRRTTGDHPLLDELVDEADQDIEHLSVSQEGKLLLRIQVLRLYYMLLQDGLDKQEALDLAGRGLLVKPDTLRKWESDFREKQKLPISQQGHYQRRFLLLHDDFMQISTQWVKDNSNRKGVANMSGADYQKFVNTEIMPLLAATITADYNPFKGLRVTKIQGEDGKMKYEICERTAVVWLQKMGFSFRGNTKGIYYDGHDRKDVLDYRTFVYLVQYFELRKCAEVWYKVTEQEAKVLLGFESKWMEDHIADAKTADDLDEGELWMCIEDIQEPFEQHPEWLKSRLQHRKLLPNGKKALFLFQDESIYKGTYLFV